MTALREQLIGAWKLVSYVEKPVDRSMPFHPFGETPQGIIMYTPDGLHAGAAARAGPQPFASGDWFAGTNEEHEAEATTYIAYTDPFEVDEEKQTLIVLSRLESIHARYSRAVHTL